MLLSVSFAAQGTPDLIATLEHYSAAFADAVWGTPTVILLLGGGLFFAIYSRLLPYRHFGHAIGLMLGRHDTPDQPGELSHGQALAAGGHRDPTEDQRAGGRVLDVDVGPDGYRDQVFYLHARCHVSRQ